MPQMAKLMISLYEQDEWNGVDKPWIPSRYARPAFEYRLASVGPKDYDV